MTQACLKAHSNVLASSANIFEPIGEWVHPLWQLLLRYYLGTTNV